MMMNILEFHSRRTSKNAQNCEYESYRYCKYKMLVPVAFQKPVLHIDFVNVMKKDQSSLELIDPFSDFLVYYITSPS